MDALFGPTSLASSSSLIRGRTGSSSGLRDADAALATPVGQLVERATAETLISTDWGLNMEACDLVNAAPECAQDAARALQARLQSPNPKILMLTLSLLMALIKNGNSDVHALLGERNFLQAVGALTEGQQGWDVKEAALKLLQECGLAFESQKDRLAFHPYYMELRLQGKQFPPLQASSPVFSPPPAPSAAIPTSASPLASLATQGDLVAAGLAKLEQDLNSVDDGIKKLQELLSSATKPVEEDDALAEAVGFLESCQPRLEEVIEAGMEGALNEALLERALVLHDELVKALDKERATSEARAAAPGPGQGAGGATDDLIDFGPDEDSKPPAPPAEAVKPIAVDAAAAAAASAAAPSSSSDAFDLLGPGNAGGAFSRTQQQPPQPPAAISTATDSAMLAEADRLLQGLGLEEKQQQEEEGEGKGPTA